MSLTDSALAQHVFSPSMLASPDTVTKVIMDEQCLYDNAINPNILSLIALCTLFQHFDEHPNYSELEYTGERAWADSINLFNTICRHAESHLGIDTSGESGTEEEIRLFTHARDDERVATILSLAMQPILTLLAGNNTGPLYLMLDDGGTLDDWGNQLQRDIPADYDNGRVPVIVFGDSLTADSLRNARLAGEMASGDLVRAVDFADNDSLAFVARLTKRKAA